MVAASPDHCTPSTMPTPISLFAESDKCGASGAHCAPTNDTAPMGMSSPLLPCSADTPGTALTPRLQLAFAEMSTMDMADRSAATTPVADDLGAACTTLPMPAVSAAHHSLLPPGPPLLHPATLCVPLGIAGLAARTAWTQSAAFWFRMVPDVCNHRLSARGWTVFSRSFCRTSGLHMAGIPLAGFWRAI